MIAQHLRHPLEGFDFRPGFWGLEWSCPSPWQVPEGILLRKGQVFESRIFRLKQPVGWDIPKHRPVKHRGWWDTIGSCESRRFHGGATCCSSWNPAGSGARFPNFTFKNWGDIFLDIAKGLLTDLEWFWLIPSLLHCLLACLIDWLLDWFDWFLHCLIDGLIVFSNTPFSDVPRHMVWISSKLHPATSDRGDWVRWRRQLSMIIPMVPCRLRGRVVGFGFFRFSLQNNHWL